jgi:hypothetical protein
MIRKKMTAGEFIKSLESDPEYIKMKEKQEQERRKWLTAFEVECSVFAHECSRFGYQIKTTGGLVGKKNLNPELVSIMIKYLYDTSYSKEFREGIASSLVVPEAAPHFGDLLDLFQREKDEGSHIRWTIALALSAAAKKQDDLNIIEQLIFDKKVGVDRNALLGAIKRMKGEQRERTITFAREDPVLKTNLQVFGLR